MVKVINLPPSKGYSLRMTVDMTCSCLWKSPCSFCQQELFDMICKLHQSLFRLLTVFYGPVSQMTTLWNGPSQITGFQGLVHYHQSFQFTVHELSGDGF